MIREALNYPPSGRHGSRAVVVGGLFFAVLAVASGVSWYLLDGEVSVTLTAIGVVRRVLVTEDVSLVLLVVVGCYLCVHLVFRGYYVAVLRTVGVADPVPVAPSFRSTRIVTDGIKSGVILLCYLVPALVLGGFGLLVRRNPTPDTQHVLINTVGAFAFLFGLFTLVAAAYLVPAATTLFARHDSLRAAFELSEIRTCVITEDYATRWVFAGVIRTVFLPIAVLLELILIGFFMRFYMNVSIQHMYALAVTSALGPDENVISL